MIGQIIVLDPKKYLLVTRCPLFFQINATFIKIQVPLEICCSEILHLLLPNWYPVSADSHVFSQPSNAKPKQQTQLRDDSAGAGRLRFSVPVAGRRWAPDELTGSYANATRITQSWSFWKRMITGPFFRPKKQRRDSWTIEYKILLSFICTLDMP